MEGKDPPQIPQQILTLWPFSPGNPARPSKPRSPCKDKRAASKAHTQQDLVLPLTQHPGPGPPHGPAQSSHLRPLWNLYMPLLCPSKQRLGREEHCCPQAKGQGILGNVVMQLISGHCKVNMCPFALSLPLQESSHGPDGCSLCPEGCHTPGLTLTGGDPSIVTCRDPGSCLPAPWSPYQHPIVWVFNHVR